MSDEYIKKEDAIKSMENRFADIIRTHKRRVTTGEKAIASDMIETAKMVKSADVAPVRHGRWIEQGLSPYEGTRRCSICGSFYDIKEQFNYCPNCGQRMDEEAEDGQDDRDR